MITRLYQVAPAHQLAATWQNADGSQTIFVTDDPSVNAITVDLVNALGNGVTFPAGKPAPYGQLAPGQSAIYLFFEGMVENGQLEAASLAAPGWTSAVAQDETSGLDYLVIAPNADVMVADGGSQAFVLTKLLASSSATSGTVTLSIVGASGITPDQAVIPIYVNVSNPPQPANRALDLIVAFVQGDEVFTGRGQDNELVLAITNPARSPLVPDGARAWGPEPPTFQLTLVYGNGQGALTTVDDGAQIHVNLSDTYGNVWKQADPKSLGKATYWVLQPDRNGGGTVLGAGKGATVTFSLSNIVTTLPQGLTLAYVGYSHIPGYNDGFFACEILKVDPIVVKSFTATPANVSGGTGPTPVQLDFEVQNASYVTIVGAGYAGPATSADFAGQVTVDVDRPTAFTLLVSNSKTGQQLAVPLNVGFQPAPVQIVSFDAVPDPVPLTGSAPQTTLRYSVRGADRVAIPAASYSKEGDPAGFSDQVPVQVKGATTFTLLASNSVTGQQALGSHTVAAAPDPNTFRTVSGSVGWRPDGSLVQAPSKGPYALEEVHPGEVQITVPPGVFTGSAPFGVSVLPHATGSNLCVGQISGVAVDPMEEGRYYFYVSARRVADGQPFRSPFDFVITQGL